MIKVKDLKLNFPGRLNLSINELSIKKGKIFAIIGPNGAGKSTFLNIIALLQKPDDGIVEIWGENILNLKAKIGFRRKISFIFSQPYLLNDTVFDNIALPLRLRSIYNKSDVNEALDLFKIRHLKANKAHTLSQGEMHRVALARAFVTRPQLILLDEPFLSLDALYKRELISQLRDIIHAWQATAIFVTQDRSEVLSLADDMILLKDGKVLQRGRPEDMLYNDNI